MQTELSADITPREVYNLFVSDEIIEHIVIETNRYAADSLASENLIKKKRKKNRLSKWAETTVDEMKKFLGLLLWMGLVRNGSIEEYWSTLPILSNQVASKTMARNRFQLLLSCIHFNNNNNVADCSDRLYKIRPLIEKLQSNFQAHYILGDSAILFYQFSM